MFLLRRITNLLKFSNTNLLIKQQCFRRTALPQQISKDVSSLLGKTSVGHFHTTTKKLFKDEVTLHFVDRNGTKLTIEAEVGDNLLDVAKDADIDGVEGACGGTLACSTCHCIFQEEDFERLGLEDIDEDELDMLDLAFGLTDTSRLVCAIEVTEGMDGIEIKVPIATNDARGA
ncbi:2Fe-2S ferredoxin-like [Clytia hemisphaerica]|uniref:2Fe-2S ferredoxin-type domain-containing protein n=1 Tax=Clytia hemisphaerica TaxID=252671 RepID=A0A7M5WVI6_9CNID